MATTAIAAPTNVDDYLAASAKFQALVAQKAEEPRMPRLTERQAGELIATLSDRQRFLNSQNYQLADMGSLMDVCGKANAAAMSYVLFELKTAVDPKSDPAVIAHQVQILMERNVREFQEELSRLQPFLVRCMAMQLPLLGRFVHTLKPEEFTVTRREGLQKSRNGTFTLYAGFLENAGNAQLRKSYRLGVLEALAETAPVFASSLPVSSRRQVADLARSASADAPSDFHAHLRRIVESMSDMRCEGLCAL